MTSPLNYMLTQIPVVTVNEKLQSGYVLLYGGFRIVWDSKLQNNIALYYIEAEYVLRSQSLIELIPLMGLFKEIVNL